MFAQSSTANGVLHVNEAEFEHVVLNSDVPVLVDFYADWCGPCRMLGPVLVDLASEVTGGRIVKVNVDDNPALAARYRINSIPAVLVFENGKVVRQHVGLANKTRLKSLLAG